MILKKKKVYTIKEFLSAPQPKETYAHPIKAYSFMGINITPMSLMHSGFNDPIFFVLGIGGFCLVAAFGEYYLKAKGYDSLSEDIANFMKWILPISFYAYLIIRIITVF